MAEPSWNPTHCIITTHTEILGLKSTFQNCFKSKPSYRSPAWSNKFNFTKIKSLDISHIICFFVFEINIEILLVIKGWGSISVLGASVMDKLTHCWCGPPMLCFRLHSCHVQSVQYKSPGGNFGGNWNSPGPPACLVGIRGSNISLSVVVTHIRLHSDPNRFLPSKVRANHHSPTIRAHPWWTDAYKPWPALTPGSLPTQVILWLPRFAVACTFMPKPAVCALHGCVCPHSSCTVPSPHRLSSSLYISRYTWVTIKEIFLQPESSMSNASALCFNSWVRAFLSVLLTWCIALRKCSK